MRAKVLGKYMLLQIPGLVGVISILYAAVRWWELSLPWAAGLLGVWVLKDALMFPFLRIAYEPASPGGATAIIGTRGVVTRPLQPTGYVAVGAELWRAETTSGESIAAGAAVVVRGIRGLTLCVERIEDGPQD